MDGLFALPSSFPRISGQPLKPLFDSAFFHFEGPLSHRLIFSLLPLTMTFPQAVLFGMGMFVRGDAESNHVSAAAA